MAVVRFLNTNRLDGEHDVALPQAGAEPACEGLPARSQSSVEVVYQFRRDYCAADLRFGTEVNRNRCIPTRWNHSTAR